MAKPLHHPLQHFYIIYCRNNKLRRCLWTEIWCSWLFVSDRGTANTLTALKNKEFELLTCPRWYYFQSVFYLGTFLHFHFQHHPSQVSILQLHYFKIKCSFFLVVLILHCWLYKTHNTLKTKGLHQNQVGVVGFLLISSSFSGFICSLKLWNMWFYNSYDVKSNMLTYAGREKSGDRNDFISRGGHSILVVAKLWRIVA